MSEHAQKCENNASFTILQNCLLLLKRPILAVLAQRISRFSRFPPKKCFITSTTSLADQNAKITSFKGNIALAKLSINNKEKEAGNCP